MRVLQKGEPDYLQKTTMRSMRSRQRVVQYGYIEPRCIRGEKQASPDPIREEGLYRVNVIGPRYR